jgi:integrase
MTNLPVIDPKSVPEALSMPVSAACPDLPPFKSMGDLAEAIAAGLLPDPNQDLRKARGAFAVHDIDGPAFAAFPLDLAEYDVKVPKLGKRTPHLARKVAEAGLSEATYKQYRAAGKRLIGRATGRAQACADRRTRSDAWAALRDRLAMLRDVGLVLGAQIGALAALMDAARQTGIDPTDLEDPDAVARLLAAAETQAIRKAVRKGLRILNDLAGTPGLKEHLPRMPIEVPRGKAREIVIPAHLEVEVQAWIATTADGLSVSSRDGVRAALRRYVATLGLRGIDVEEATGLLPLFDDALVEDVFGAWAEGETLAPKSYVTYARHLAKALACNAGTDEAGRAAQAEGVLARARENRAIFARGKAKVMGRRGQEWCRALVNDRARSDLFETQHLEYYARALSALAEAKENGIDLVRLSDSEVMVALPRKRRSVARRLLRRARVFGLLAAYTAIALEGAPYRRTNMLRLRHTGQRKTFFDHLTGPDPHAVIRIPNEELKNGLALTAAGEDLPPLTLRAIAETDRAPEILKFYLKNIRPLFPGDAHSESLFPPVIPQADPAAGLPKGTFDIWLAEASAEIGLPMTSHHFRHGFVTLALEYGTATARELAVVMGHTTTATLLTFYAFLDREKGQMRVQTDVAGRRAEAAARRAEAVARRGRTQSRRTARGVQYRGAAG